MEIWCVKGMYRPKVVKNFKVILKSGKTCMYIHKHTHSYLAIHLYIIPFFSFPTIKLNIDLVLVD